MGTICQGKVYERVTFFVKNVISKGNELDQPRSQKALGTRLGLDLGAEPPRIKHLLSTPGQTANVRLMLRISQNRK